MKLELLSELLEQRGLGTRGTDIFVHRMDAECPKGILLRLPIAGIDTDFNLPGYYKTQIQAIIRDANQQSGDAMAVRVMAQLTMYERIFTDPDTGAFLMQINQMYPAKLPIIYPRSEGQEIEWSLNFDVSYAIPPLEIAQ